MKEFEQPFQTAGYTPTLNDKLGQAMQSDHSGRLPNLVGQCERLEASIRTLEQIVDALIHDMFGPQPEPDYDRPKEGKPPGVIQITTQTLYQSGERIAHLAKKLEEARTQL